MQSSSPQNTAAAGPDVKPELASIIQRTRTATTKAELLQLCDEAIAMNPGNNPETLQAYYQKRIEALPSGS